MIRIEEYKGLIKFLYDSYDTAWFMYDIENMEELQQIDLINELLDLGMEPLFYSTSWKEHSNLNTISFQQSTSSFFAAKQIYYFSSEIKHSDTRYARDYALAGIKFNIYHEERIIQIIGLDLEAYILQYKRQIKIDSIIK